MLRFRSSFLICLFCVSLLAILSACDFGFKRSERPTKTNTNSPEVLEANKTFSDSQVVVHTEDFDVTLGDYKRCIAGHAIQGYVFSKRALANPNFQREASMRCLQSVLMRRFAEQNQIRASADVIEKKLDEYVANAKLSTVEELAQKLDYPVNRMQELVEDSIRPQTLQRYFAHQIAHDKQHELFMIDYRRFSVDWLTFNNEISEEVAIAFMKEHPQELSAAFETHHARFKTKPKAEFIRFAFSLNGDDLNDGMAFQDANRIRNEAIKNGDHAAMELCKKTESCNLLNDMANPYVLERTDEIKWAFRSPLGTVSDVLKEDATCEVLIVKNIIPPEEPNLKDEAVRLKIAREILADYIPDIRLIEKLKPLLTDPNCDVRTVTKDNGGLYRYIENARFMDFANEDKIPSKIVRETLKTVTDNDLMVFSDPLVENGKIQIFRARQAITPTEEEFQAQKSKWLEEKSNDPTTGLVQTWLESNTPRMSSLNINAIQDAYGQLTPNGVIL